MSRLKAMLMIVALLSYYTAVVALLAGGHAWALMAVIPLAFFGDWLLPDASASASYSRHWLSEIDHDDVDGRRW